MTATTATTTTSKSSPWMIITAMTTINPAILTGSLQQ